MQSRNVISLIENKKVYRFTAKNEAGINEQLAYIEDESITFEQLKNSPNQDVEITAEVVKSNRR